MESCIDMEEKVTAEVKVGVSDMYRFFLYHAYCGYSGILGLIISFGALVLLLCGVADSDFSKAMLILLAALFTVINPLQLYLKAARQVKLSPAFKKPLSYEFTGEGMTVRQGEEELTLKWEDFCKAVIGKKEIYLFTSAVHASILPRSACKEAYEKIAEMAGNRVPVRRGRKRKAGAEK